MNGRPYQLDCLAAFRAGWAEWCKQLGVLPTGSGKTIIFSWMAREFADRGERILVLVDQSELAWQTVDKMSRAAGVTCAVEKAEFSAGRGAQVVCATVQTMARRLDDWPADHFGLVIADEADKSISKQWQTVLKHFDTHAKVAGFTATPNRTDKKNLGEYYENVAYEISLTDLINQGYLSPIRIKQLPIKIDLTAVKITRTAEGSDFDRQQLSDAITPHLIECALAIRQHASFRKVLVFVPLIATSLKFVEILRTAGLAAEHIDGNSDDRDDKLRRFAAGEFDVLVNSALLLRGIDIPSIDCVMLLRATKSVTLAQQAYGRGTRLSPETGKEDLLILDVLFQTDKQLVIRPAHLVAKSQEEAESIIEVAGQASPPPGEAGEQLTALDLLGMASEAQALRERKLRKKIEEHQDKQARTISAAEFALRHKHLDVAEYEPTMAWERQEPSEKQLKYIKQAGIDVATVRGKGHASKLLSIHFGNRPINLASEGQRALMQRMGHPNAANATAGEARTFFAGLRNKRKEPALL